MKTSKYIQLEITREQIFAKLSDCNILKKLFLDSNILNLNSNHFNVKIQSKDITEGIAGYVYYKKKKINVSKTFFTITLVNKKSVSKFTNVHLTLSDHPYYFSKLYQQKLEKNSKKYTKVGTLSALTIVTLFVSITILSSFDPVTKESEKISTLLSDKEQQVATAEFYLASKEPETAFKLYKTIRLENPDSVESILGSRLSIFEMRNYDQFLLNYDSILIFDPNYPDPKNPDETILQVLFYPEGSDGPGILIPRTNAKKTTLDISLDTFTENVIPSIVYPIDSQYPTLLYPKSLDAKPQIVDAESLESIDAQNHIIITPGQLTHPEAKFIPFIDQPPLEYQTGKEGPLIIYPYGISDMEDLPGIVFPGGLFYPLRIAMNSLSEDVILPADYNSDQLAKSVPNTLLSDNDQFTGYIDLIFENGIKDTSILSQINPNIPVRIFPDGPDSIPIEYPAGLDFSQSVTFPSVDKMNHNVPYKTSPKK